MHNGKSHIVEYLVEDDTSEEGSDEWGDYAFNSELHFGTKADESYIIADPVAIMSSPGGKAAMDNCSEVCHGSCGLLDLESKQCKVWEFDKRMNQHCDTGYNISNYMST